jgi:hypothetical protein
MVTGSFGMVLTFSDSTGSFSGSASSSQSDSLSFS